VSKPREPNSSATVVSLGRDILEPLPGETDPVASFRAAAASRSELVDGRYELGAEIGRGGMGVVRRAVDVALERPVALKLVHPEMLARPEIVELFQLEARALAAIRNENVVGIYAFGLHLESFFFAMELVDGESLEQLVRAHATAGELVPLHRAVVILQQVAAGLDDVHRAGLIHRDVKPDNIIIERGSGRPVLVDFGLAVAATAEGGRFRAAGTPGYMAPELVRGEVPTSRVDVYSFACTAFEVLTGRSVFDGATSEEVVRRHAISPAPSISSIRPDLAGADDIIARGLAKDPLARPATCGAFAEELAASLQGFAHVERLFSSVPPASIPPTSEPAALQALVVDDDPDFAKLAARALAIAFHGKPAKVTVAHDGERGLEAAATRMPRLLLLDFDMPRMDGLEMLSRLRALPGASSCRVVVISAAGARLPRHNFQLLGVEDILAKPVPFPGLLAMLQTVASRDALATGAAPPKTLRRGELPVIRRKG
jgi:CheY-like chemotaxis protein